MALKKIIFDKYILLLSDDVRDVFRYYNVSTIDGKTHENATKIINQNGIYCDSWASLAPHKAMKPFIYINTKTLIELPLNETGVLIFKECLKMAHLLFLTDTGGETIFDINATFETFERLIIEDAENMTKEINRKLKFPAIHFNHNIK